MTSSQPCKDKGFPKRQSFYECETRKEFEQFIFNVYKEYYGLVCNCDECGPELDFYQASSHYHHCNYWKFTHAINRALDWAEARRASSTSEDAGIRSRGAL